MSIYGGEIFGKTDVSGIYKIYRDQQAMQLQEKRYKDQQRREQQAKDYKVGNALKTAFDSSHLTTGTPADPVINERLKGLMDKYSRMYKESQGSLDLTDLSMGINRDMMDIKAYYDSVNVIKSNAMKSADALAKQYPGFNKQELYQKAMDRALYKDGQVIQDLTDLDLQNDYVNDVVDNDYGSLHIGQKGLYSDLQKLPVKPVTKEIVTRDKAGLENRYKGQATYNERFQDITYNPETGEPKIGLKTIPVTSPTGASYIDKLTGQPVNTIDEQAYQEMTSNRQLGARINQIADERLAALKAKNIPIDDADKEILRRQVATEQLDGVFKNRTSFLSSNKQALPRGRYRVGTATDPLPFNLDAMQQDADKNKDLTPQLGGFTIKDPTSRSGNTSAELWLTPKGGLIVRSYKHDTYGNRIGQNPDPPALYGQAARNFIEDNSGWSANNKKDLFKLLDLYNGEGEAPIVESSDLFPDPYKDVKKPKPVVSKPSSEKKSIKPSNKNSLTW